MILFDLFKTYHHEGKFKLPVQEWWRLDDAAPWRLDRPGPSPFKRIGNPWSGLVPGAESPARIKPDMVHTFHIGFGQDLASSCIVWLAHLGLFGNGPFDEKLRGGYSCFREFCHTEKRYTSCDQWCLKKLKMTSTLNCIYIFYFICCNGFGESGYCRET